MRIWAALLMAATALAQEPSKSGALTAVCADSEISDFGLECSLDEPCPVYLELSTVEQVGGKLFLAGNLHTESATLWSLLLMSPDEGKTWSEPFSRIRGASLDQVLFVDFENGWASGQINGSLPKDPFLLKTTDAGKTWRRITLFEDTAYGSIEQFWFDSKTHGYLVLNRKGTQGGRFQKMETMSGGDTWMMREVSPSAIAGPRARGATGNNADLRIRTDSATKSFRVEQRREGKWNMVASFPVRAGACQPAPPKPAEPPADKPPEHQ